MVGSIRGLTAAILAGGFGTRLRPVLTDRPKVLAPVRGRPWITYLLDQLAAAGIRAVVLLTGYRADQVQAVLGDRYDGLRLHYSTEPVPLGTAGALRLALDQLPSSPVLVLNGDSSVALDLGAFVSFHQRHGAPMSMVLTWLPDTSRFGKVDLGCDERIRRLMEKGTAGPGWINAGVYLLECRLIEEVPPRRPVSLEREMLPVWASRGSVYGFRCPGPFLDIGTPESYAQVADFLEAVGPATRAGPTGKSCRAPW